MCAAITPDSVTEESAAPAASPAPPGAGAEAGGRTEVGTREAQRKRKHRLISEPRADEVEVDERARQRTWIGYLYGSARLLFQMLPRGSTSDYITPSGWWSQQHICFHFFFQRGAARNSVKRGGGGGWERDGIQGPLLCLQGVGMGSYFVCNSQHHGLVQGGALAPATGGSCLRGLLPASLPATCLSSLVRAGVPQFLFCFL
jgi:hypothetical protein